MRVTAVALTLLLACAAPPPPPAADAARISFGPLATDVRADSALVWARASEATQIEFLVDSPSAVAATAPALAERDFTASARVTGLRPGTRYTLRARAGSGVTAESTFTTPPAPDDPAKVRVAWGGDLAGQNVCRDERSGFAIFNAVLEYGPDVFIGLGDMIYADNVCEPVGRYGNPQLAADFREATDLPSYWAHWRYARADAHLAALLKRAAYVAVWDDHEVVNDFGPLQDTRSQPPYREGVHLMPIGLQAFLDYNPVSSDSRETPGRLYRSLRIGKHVELFVLDTRQYRDSNFAADKPPSADPLGEIEHAKSMLGREQLTWLTHSIAASDATWKVVVSSVPLGTATGSPATRGRDGWAGVDQDTGFARERDEILRFLAERGIQTPIWITTDVHYAEIFVHHPFADRPDFRVIEAITGPMNAGVGIPQLIDPSLRSEIHYLHAPTAESPIKSWSEALGYFNFGALEFAANGELTLRVIGVSGKTMYEERVPAPQ